MSDPMNDKEINRKLEVENSSLRKEITSLHGRLGNQAKEIMREEKYQALDVELKGMYHEVEKAQEGKKILRDKIAIAAMQGFIGKVNLESGTVFKALSDKSYEMADEMIKRRSKNDV